VNECNITVCNGTTCPPNNCDSNASCTNTDGSFTCACGPGLSALGSVGDTCVVCPATMYKNSTGNDNCTHCGTYSPPFSTNYSACEQPLLRYLFESTSPAVPNVGTAGSILDGVLTPGAVSIVDGKGGTNALSFTSSASFIASPGTDFVAELQQAWVNASASRNSFTVAYWVKAQTLNNPSLVFKFEDAANGVYLNTWHSTTQSQIIVSDGTSSCCPGTDGSLLTGPAVSLGVWVHVAFTYSVQKYPVRNSAGVDPTDQEVAYGYGAHNITQSNSWDQDLKLAYSLGAEKAFDEEFGDTLLSAVAGIDATLPWAPDKYGGTWMCATSVDGVAFNKFYPVRLLLGGQVECHSTTTQSCNETNYFTTRTDCQNSLTNLERNHIGFRRDPSSSHPWTKDFDGVQYDGFASNATYDVTTGAHDPSVGSKARIYIEHPGSFELLKYKISCSSWRIASCPGTFTMEASSDGVTWLDLGQAGPIDTNAWTANSVQTITIASPVGEMAVYRLTVDSLAGVGGAGESGRVFANLDELELWGEEAMALYFDGAQQAVTTAIDGTQPLPGLAGPFDLKVMEVDGEVAVDDLQFWTSVLDSTQIGYLQYSASEYAP